MAYLGHVETDPNPNLHVERRFFLEVECQSSPVHSGVVFLI